MAASRWLPFAALAALALGAGLRVYHWAAGRSLWLDEAYIAANVQARDLIGLLQPLEYNQSAPYLFLASTDVLTEFLGFDERVLRFLPLAASLVSLALFWKLAQGRLNPWLAALVVAAMSFTYQLVYYAQEFKHYAGEVLVVVLVLYLLARLQASPAQAPARFWLLWWAGAVGLFLAHTAPFVLAGAGLAVAVAKLRQDLPLSWKTLLVGAAGWVALFGVNYWFFIRPNYANPFMEQYWAFARPGAPWTLSGLREWVVLLNEYLSYLGYRNGFELVFAGVVALGIFQAWRTQDAVIWAAAAAIAAYGFAVMIGKAPFAGRLALFLFPMALLLAAHGLSTPLRRSFLGLRVAAGLLLVVPLVTELARSLKPIVVQNQREAIAYLVAHRKPGEPVHVVFQAQPALRFYRAAVEDVTTHYDFGSEHRVWMRGGPGQRPRSRPDPEILRQEIRPLTAQPVFWVLAAHMYEREAEMVKDIESTFGYVPTLRFKTPGAGAYRFEPGSPSPQESEAPLQ